MEEFLDILLIVSALLLGLYVSLPGLYGVLYGRSSKTWPSVTGVIVVSKVIDDSESCLAKVHFRYWVGSKNYLGKNIGFCKYGTKFNAANHLKDARLIANQYPKGGNVNVYYHPNWPGIAILEPGFRWASVFVLLFGLMIIGVSMTIIFN